VLGQNPSSSAIALWYGLRAFLIRVLRIPHSSVLRKRGTSYGWQIFALQIREAWRQRLAIRTRCVSLQRKNQAEYRLVKGANGKPTEEKHAECAYFLNFNNTWIPVGVDALEAQHQPKVELNHLERERLSGKTAPPGPNLVQLGRKVIKDEVDAYLANLELAKRPFKTVGEKRRFLASFLKIVPKKFVDEFSRNDLLIFRNELMAGYDSEYVSKQMMAVVTFFNQIKRVTFANNLPLTLGTRR
jgi:hypothetical protein